MQFQIDGPVDRCSDEDALYATCTYDSDTNKVIVTSCVSGFAVEQDTCEPACSSSDWVNNATTNHFTADCTAALKDGEQCVVTMATGYFGGKVVCVDQSTHFEYMIETEATLCGVAVPGAATCTYDPSTNFLNVTSCAPMRNTQCYPRCEKKTVSSWTGPIANWDAGAEFGCAPLCNASDADYGWVNNEAENHFVADCSNAVKRKDAVLLLLLLLLLTFDSTLFLPDQERREVRHDCFRRVLLCCWWCRLRSR
jgi:hypothetical protein